MSLQCLRQFGGHIGRKAAARPTVHHSQAFSTVNSSRFCSDTPQMEASGDSDPAGQKAKSENISSRVKRVLERRKYRFAFPEFLPDPEPLFRNPLVEMLQRKDMLKRREKVNMPEFYVGSIVAVTMSDPNATTDNKTTTFTGIVIDRGGTGLRAWFVLRNVIDHQGIEISYRMYSPNILSIETLKLERRIDDELYYLRDADPEHSTVDPNMSPILLAEGEPVPLNDTVVELGPKPWTQRWELKDDLLKGFKYKWHQLTSGQPGIRRDMRTRKNWDLYLNPGWERSTRKYDLMVHYKRTIPVEQQDAIWEEVGDKLEARDKEIKRAAIKRSLVKTEKKL